MGSDGSTNVTRFVSFLFRMSEIGYQHANLASAFPHSFCLLRGRPFLLGVLRASGGLHPWRRHECPGFREVSWCQMCQSWQSPW